MDEKNPYLVRSSREVYDNPWIKVREHAIVTPSGRDGIYGVVEFKNQAVGVVPYEAGKIWLVGQYRFPLAAYSWEIPEGGAPHGESAEDCARRELLEETGLRAGKLDQLLSMHLSNSVSNEVAFVFLARELERGAPQPEDTEQLQVRQVSLSDALDLVLRGGITDSMSVAAILRLELLRRDGQL